VTDVSTDPAKTPDDEGAGPVAVPKPRRAPAQRAKQTAAPAAKAAAPVAAKKPPVKKAAAPAAAKQTAAPAAKKAAAKKAAPPAAPPVVAPAVPPVVPHVAATDDTADAAVDEAVAPKVRRGRVARVAWYSTVVLLAGFLLVCAIWTITGGRTYVVTTPSMSPTVPVGSLVLTRPVPPGGPKVGQIIAFHPPTEPKTTYTHRVVKILPGPSYSTKGDLDTSPDAWVVPAKDVLGVATHHYRGLGWLVRALPWLALGAVLLMGIATFTPRSRRRITYFIGGTIVLSVPILVLKPLVRGVFAGSGVFSGKLHAMVVNTGLLPLRFVMKGAPTQHTAAGYPTTLVAKPPTSGHVLITGTVDLSFWGWVILVLICLSPLIIALAVPRKYWEGDVVDADAELEPELEPELTSA
jgi:signal peptidase I